jgi:competence protein ComEC
LGFVIVGIVLYFVAHIFLVRTGVFLKNKILLTLFCISILGLALGFGRGVLWLSFNHSGVLDNLINKKVYIKAIVIEEPQVSESSSKIIAKTITDSSSSTMVVGSAKILITAERYSEVAYGDEIKLFGKVLRPKKIESAEGDFAYDVYLSRQGIFYNMVFPSVYVISSHHGNIAREYLISIKNIFLAKVNELFVSPKSGLLSGLLVSGRSSLSKSEQTEFTQAGLVHIVALSGFNVTIIAQGLMVLLIFLPKKLRLAIGACGIVAFLVMTGFGATVVRAGIMALLTIVAALVYRNYDVGRALFVAVLAMVLWDPMIIYSISFQLSCIATFAVVFAVTPVLEQYGKYAFFLPEKFMIREIVLGTTVIEIFLLPILLSTSGQISLVTVITNLLVLPILPAVMGVGFLATMIGYIHTIIALPFVAISNLMLSYILIVTKIFAYVPFGVVSFQIPNWAVVVMYIIIGFAFWRLQINNLKIKRTANSGVYAKSAAVGTTAALNNTWGTAFTSANLERLDNFFQSHSNSNSQKKP